MLCCWVNTVEMESDITYLKNLHKRMEELLELWEDYWSKCLSDTRPKKRYEAKSKITKEQIVRFERKLRAEGIPGLPPFFRKYLLVVGKKLGSDGLGEDIVLPELDDIRKSNIPKDMKRIGRDGCVVHSEENPCGTFYNRGNWLPALRYGGGCEEPHLLAITICDYGAGSTSYIVLDGTHRGEVWSHTNEDLYLSNQSLRGFIEERIKGDREYLPEGLIGVRE